MKEFKENINKIAIRKWKRGKNFFTIVGTEPHIRIELNCVLRTFRHRETYK